MGLLRFVEQKLFLGEVLADYGVIDEYRQGIASVRISALLCRRGGRLRLVFRERGFAFLAAGVHYVSVNLSEESVERLSYLFEDVKKRLRSL